MKVLIFSDLHAHNYQEFSELNEFGISNRLQSQLDTLQDLRSCAVENKADVTLFGGDLLHLKNFADSQVLKHTVEHLAALADVAPIYLCAGNHDYKSWNRDPVLLEMASGLLQEIYMVDVAELEDNWNLFVFHYQRNVETIQEVVRHWKKSDKSIGLFHQDIIGSQYGGIINEKGLDAKELAEKFAWAFVGHFHQPQRYCDNVISIGAPLAHNFSDANISHGWWLLDTEAGEAEYIVNARAPQFVDIGPEDVEHLREEPGLLPGRPEVDFYRVRSARPEVPEAIQSIRWKRWSLVAEESEQKRRTSLKFSDDTSTLIKKYIGARAPEHLDRDRLEAVGKRFLL